MQFWRRRTEEPAPTEAAPAPEPEDVVARLGAGSARLRGTRRPADAATRRRSTRRADVAGDARPALGSGRPRRRARVIGPRPLATGEPRRRARSGPGAASCHGCAASSAAATVGGPSWDEVEETLIAGDVGAALAIELVERARARRDPAGPEAAVRAELAALLVPRDVALDPAPGDRRRPGGRPRRRRQRHRQDDDDRQARQPLRGRGARDHPGRRGHLPGGGHRAAPDLGRSRPACRSWPTRRAPTPGPSSTTRSTRRSPAAPTS